MERSPLSLAIVLSAGIEKKHKFDSRVASRDCYPNLRWTFDGRQEHPAENESAWELRCFGDIKTVGLALRANEKYLVVIKKLDSLQFRPI